MSEDIMSKVQAIDASVTAYTSAGVELICIIRRYWQGDVGGRVSGPTFALVWEDALQEPMFFNFREAEWSGSDGQIIERICQRWALGRFHKVPVRKPPQLTRVK